MSFDSFTVQSHSGWYDYPLSGKTPFRARISLRDVDALSVIDGCASAGPLMLPRQVHGTAVLCASECRAYPQRDDADGLLIAPGDPLCGLRFADCCPVLIEHGGDRPWLLALHSGFRGTLLNIVASGMRLARERFGISNPEELRAWAGPCISGECYDRRADDPSTAQALEVFVPQAFREAGDRVFFDLKAQIAFQLAQEGIPSRNIMIESQCTCCDQELFYSHRRSVPGNDPRMILLVHAKDGLCTTC